MVDYNDGNWHGWTGMKCPVHPESLVQIMFPDGEKTNPGREKAGSLEWGDCGSGSIVAFRVIEECKEPRELWMDDEGDFWAYYENAKHYCEGEPVKFREVIK